MEAPTAPGRSPATGSGWAETDWHLPSTAEELPAELPAVPVPLPRAVPPRPEPLPRPAALRPKRATREVTPAWPPPAQEGVFVIQEENDLTDILRELERGKTKPEE